MPKTPPPLPPARVLAPPIMVPPRLCARAAGRSRSTRHACATAATQASSQRHVPACHEYTDPFKTNVHFSTRHVTAIDLSRM